MCDGGTGGIVGGGRKGGALGYAFFSVSFVVLAVAMTLWIDLRFRRLSPGGLRAGGLRLLAAVVVAQVAVPVVARVVAPLPNAVESWTIVGAGFAAMVFLMLAVVWMLRLAQGLMGGMLR